MRPANHEAGGLKVSIKRGTVPLSIVAIALSASFNHPEKPNAPRPMTAEISLVSDAQSGIKSESTVLLNGLWYACEQTEVARRSTALAHRSENQLRLMSFTTVLIQEQPAGQAAYSTLLNEHPDVIRDFEKIAVYESESNWHINSGNGFSGGLQFTNETWQEFGGNEFAPIAYLASQQQQIVVAYQVLKTQGPEAWPVTSREAGVYDGLLTYAEAVHKYS
jgi:hypothetical protein